MRGLFRGVEVVWDEDKKSWLWADSLEPAEQSGSFRPCPRCNRTPEPCPRGCPVPHDPCLGHIEGALSCCCGHGLFVGHINWPGLSVDGDWYMGVKLLTEADSL